MRGPLIVGVDVSSFALHAAAIPLDPGIYAPADFRYCDIKRAPEAERLRKVRAATHHVLADSDGDEVCSVWVEKPPPPSKFAMQGHDLLVAVYGAVCSNTPKCITACASLMPSEWRATVKLSLSPKQYPSEKPSERWKRAAIERVMASDLVAPDFPINSHYADALLLALAGRYLIHKHDDELRLAKGAAA